MEWRDRIPSRKSWRNTIALLDRKTTPVKRALGGLTLKTNANFDDNVVFENIASFSIVNISDFNRLKKNRDFNNNFWC